MREAPVVRLGEVARELSLKAAADVELPVYSVTKHAGFVPSLEFFSKRVFSRDVSSYKVVRRNQFAYATIHLDEGSLGLLESDDAVLISPMYTVFEVNTDRVHPPYLYRALKSPRMIARYSRLGKGSIHRRKAIAFERLANVTIPLPSLIEQRRIANALGTADGIRAKRKASLALSENLLRATFVAMFGDPLKAENRWSMVPLRELGRVTTGNTPSRAVPEYFGSDIEWIKSDNINTPSHFLTRADEGLSKQGRAEGRTARSGSTLMTCIAGSPACIGNVALADREVAFNQQINAITPHDDVDYRYLYVLLLVGKRLVQAASTNSMKGMVSKGRLEEVRLPKPPPKLQAEFGEAFDRILALSRRQEAASAESDRLFNTVLGNAFGGSTRLGAGASQVQRHA